MILTKKSLSLEKAYNNPSIKKPLGVFLSLNIERNTSWA
jgi:hypothetical protein